MDKFAAVFIDWVERFGLEGALEHFRGGPFANGQIDEWVAEYQRLVEGVKIGYPPKMLSAPGLKPWYPGPLDHHKRWPAFRDSLTQLPADVVEKLDQSTSKIVANTHSPDTPRYLTKGLVVGYVQSGKTTSFTGVAAKAADTGYKLVIVLSGIHNGLRRQTQERLQAQLVETAGDGAWFPLTDATKDFHKPSATFAAHQGGDRTILIVAKKQKDVLARLLNWLTKAAKDGALANAPALIIDDEADQASVATAKINPQIRSLLKLFPRCAYIGYTATPFANVLIDPSIPDELYPETFILNLPEPDGYFGAEKIFGRDAIEGEYTGPQLDGYDMVRIVPDNTVAQIRPVGRGSENGFVPTITEELAESLRYFILATAARRHRGDESHSTMLVHTGMKTVIHDAYREPLRNFFNNLAAAVKRQDPDTLTKLKTLWEKETKRVPASRFDGLTPVRFDELVNHLSEVFGDVKVIVDNFRSRDRLDYSGARPVVAVAVGGNTLSRGLTLEGLVVSFFVRSANTYDTLLQMGRWFGYRNGYEDLPRIWMTKGLKADFRHLATVEAEIRLDIARYEEQNLSPREVGVRIRTHPVLNITAKMGAARISYASYGGRRVQTRYFRENDDTWLGANRVAATALVTEAIADGVKVDNRGDGTMILRDVDVSHVLTFLQTYRVHEGSPDLDPRLVTAYIGKESRRAHPSLLTWNVALMGTPVSDVDHVVDFGGGIRLGTINRSLIKDTGGDEADIKTLMSKEHRVIDMDISASEARGKSEGALVDLRNASIEHATTGLLLLYPIARDSQPDPANIDSRVPFNATDHVIGMALVFPGNAEDKVSNKYVQVDTSGVDISEYDEINDALEGSQDPETA
ncbi:Z1 domain-containing protein [Streptosporangium sp. 'caverna']|uniref:Z1 domain-containing protein n=1 Tax=Streptosporangium sp. 'caverna' TaxID=2202249 RepID=UPI0013A6C572|nr:Z1 domain-containing protein [Streptosporangium sp. 'caverna']